MNKRPVRPQRERLSQIEELGLLEGEYLSFKEMLGLLNEEDAAQISEDELYFKFDYVGRNSYEVALFRKKELSNQQYEEALEHYKKELDEFEKNLEIDLKIKREKRIKGLEKELELLRSKV